MAPENSTESDDNVELPDDLIASMRELVRAKVPVDSNVDERILGEARVHLQQIRDAQPSLHSSAGRTNHWKYMAITLAAAVLLAVGLHQFSPPISTRNVVSSSSIREDLDRNGQVDILDALMLAQRVKRGGPIDNQWDVNGDGRVDQSDVRQVALLAVQIKSADRKGQIDVLDG